MDGWVCDDKLWYGCAFQSLVLGDCPDSDPCYSSRLEFQDSFKKAKGKTSFVWLENLLTRSYFSTSAHFRIWDAGYHQQVNDNWLQLLYSKFKSSTRFLLASLALSKWPLWIHLDCHLWSDIYPDQPSSNTFSIIFASTFPWTLPPSPWWFLAEIKLCTALHILLITSNDVLTSAAVFCNSSYVSSLGWLVRATSGDQAIFLSCYWA